jgi:U3 small nucleolar ribonucleoprotein component
VALTFQSNLCIAPSEPVVKARDRKQKEAKVWKSNGTMVSFNELVESQKEAKRRNLAPRLTRLLRFTP